MTSTISRTAPRPPGARVIKWACALDLGHGIGGASGQADSQEDRQVRQVVAHKQTWRGERPSRFDQRSERRGLLFVTLEHVCDLELGRAALDGRRAAAREDRRLFARPVPQAEGQAVARRENVWSRPLGRPSR